MLQGASKAKSAVQSLSLVIERGEVFGLLGPNGAGKTTAIKLMTGFLEPTAGGSKCQTTRPQEGELPHFRCNDWDPT